MTLEGLTWIVVVNGLVQLAGLVILVLSQRDLARMTREVEAMVDWEKLDRSALAEELHPKAHR